MAKELNPFEQTIKTYLDRRAAEDPQFAERYANTAKSIPQCCNFIIGEVRKAHRTAFADDEVYGLAVHYYDEADLGEIKPQKCKVVVPGKAQKETSPAQPTSTPKPRKAARVQDATPSLFDF